MALIDTNLNTPPTLQEKQDNVKKRLIRQAKSTFQQLASSYKGSYDLVWNNPQGLTPQEVLDALGTDAGDLFALSQLVLNTMESAKPGSTAELPVTDPADITVNPDGTVTVNV